MVLFLKDTPQTLKLPCRGFTSTSTQQLCCDVPTHQQQQPRSATTWKILPLVIVNSILTRTEAGYSDATQWLFWGIGNRVWSERSPRSCIFPSSNGPSLRQQYLRMISPHCNDGAEAQRDTIGQAERNSVSFGKQKSPATCRGSSSGAFKPVGKVTINGLTRLYCHR